MSWGTTVTMREPLSTFRRDSPLGTWLLLRPACNARDTTDQALRITVKTSYSPLTAAETACYPKEKEVINNEAGLLCHSAWRPSAFWIKSSSQDLALSYRALIHDSQTQLLNWHGNQWEDWAVFLCPSFISTLQSHQWKIPFPSEKQRKQVGHFFLNNRTVCTHTHTHGRGGCRESRKNCNQFPTNHKMESFRCTMEGGHKEDWAYCQFAIYIVTESKIWVKKFTENFLIRVCCFKEGLPTLW